MPTQWSIVATLVVRAVPDRNCATNEPSWHTPIDKNKIGNEIAI